MSPAHFTLRFLVLLGLREISGELSDAVIPHYAELSRLSHAGEEFRAEWF
jgi:hypothetical protein